MIFKKFNKSSMKEKKDLFILGLGAQKAGTTWLFNSLKAAGVLDKKNKKSYRANEHIKNLLCSDRKPTLISLRSSHDWLTWRMQKSESFYFDYFYNIIQSSVSGIAADLTPANSLVSRQNLQAINRSFSVRGIETKLVLLTRDPVERCWSAFCMHYFLKKKPKEGVRIDLDFRESFRRYMKSDDCRLRTDYSRIISVVSDAHLASRLLVIDYSDLFTSLGLNALQDFIGVKINSDLLNNVVNHNHEKRPIPDGLGRECAAEYGRVYSDMTAFQPNLGEAWEWALV